MLDALLAKRTGNVIKAYIVRTTMGVSSLSPSCAKGAPNFAVLEKIRSARCMGNELEE
jgi:hypothetical protein